jgi:hypothetical protein
MTIQKQYLPLSFSLHIKSSQNDSKLQVESQPCILNISKIHKNSTSRYNKYIIIIHRIENKKEINLSIRLIPLLFAVAAAVVAKKENKYKTKICHHFPVFCRISLSNVFFLFPNVHVSFRVNVYGWMRNKEKGKKKAITAANEQKNQ